MIQEKLDEFKDKLNKRDYGYTAYHNFYYDKITKEEVVVCFDPTKNFANHLGKLHGGVIYTLADTVAGILCFANDKPSVTLKGSMDYLKEIDLKKVTGTARFINETYRTSVIEVRIESNGELCGYGVFNYYRLKNGNNIALDFLEK